MCQSTEVFSSGWLQRSVNVTKGHLAGDLWYQPGTFERIDDATKKPGKFIAGPWGVEREG
jgi:hypothetical protein